ncbi:glycoside hydrolase family 20 protein [Wolfiporia cocos MD-104 SS10]|uniref:beta-N-acetylhexosaminidase n=1 Tax=Wolfiporia cocos (strain MD-104) TaxID=742152 RepID=A0A2H3IWU0_WOLCO|nr:glycoside hydrolase family 20 protein [Wolfiporia cocos MD-104 SS10]
MFSWTVTSALCLAVFVPSTLGANLHPQIPSVASFTPAGSFFELSPAVRIVVVDEHGLDGSPSTFSYTETFRGNLVSVTGYDTLPPVELSSSISGSDGAPVIYIQIDPSLNFTLYNGLPTDEGYNFNISEYTYTIKAAAPIGAWWGAVTLLQQVALTVAEGKDTISIPTGSGTDSPGWEVRGFMLDAGRHWFDTSFLSELCIYASFFKLNEFHVHTSDFIDNPDYLYGVDWKELYAAFRFQPPPDSPIAGLVTRLNESWPQADFLAFQETCNAHGVAIIPEIDTPGHSLVFTQWKPELMIPGHPDFLNLSYPETIPTVKSVWQEFLPWFTSPEVSIGADEYNSSLADPYISFVNEMAEYMYEEADKAIRVWGTYEPSTTESISRNVTIQHWYFPDASIPVQLLAAGYRVINSEQSFLYLDEKYAVDGEYPHTLNATLLFGGAPGGGGWAPNVFTRDDPSNNTTPDHPRLRGAIMALWSDWGNNATTMLEDYYQLARSVALVGEKTWAGSGVRDTELTLAQFEAAYPALNAAAPGQNLNRVVKPEHGNVVYAYSEVASGLITPYTSVGPPYTLLFTVMPSSEDPDTGTLFSGIDSRLHVANLTFEATGQLYALGYVLPANTYTQVEIHATHNYTYAIIDGNADSPYYWYTYLEIWGEYTEVANMSFAAPAWQIGGDGFSGTVKDVLLTIGYA